MPDELWFDDSDFGVYEDSDNVVNLTWDAQCAGTTLPLEQVALIHEWLGEWLKEHDV